MPSLVNPPRHNWVCLSVLVAFLSQGATGGVQEEAPSTLTPPIKRRIAPEGSEVKFRPPLLREGGYLVRTPGEVTLDTTIGVHRFHPLQVEEGGIRRELILLPSRAMDDLIHLLSVEEKKKETESTVFEITGKVLVYRGRNFLLPDSVVPLKKSASDVRKELKPDAIGAAPVNEEMPVETDPDALAKSIEERLEDRIGAVPRSLQIARASDKSEKQSLKHKAGTHLQDRRGHLLRDPSSGTWRFVFEGSSVTMELLPCKQLELIERSIRPQVVPRAVTVSGRVTTFHNQNFLLPTSFRVAREGRGIGP